MKPTTLSQGKQVLQFIDDQRLTSDQLNTLLNGGYLADLAQSARLGVLPGREDFQKALGVYRIVRIYPMSWVSIIEQSKYHFVDEKIQTKFPFHIIEPSDFEWGIQYPVSRYTSITDLRAHIESDAENKNAWTPAGIEQLLFFGRVYPKYFQSSTQIIALGALADADKDNYEVPQICGYHGMHSLETRLLPKANYRPSSSDRFLQYRKITISA